MTRTPRILSTLGLLAAPLLVLLAPTAATADDGCDHVLVTHSPSGSEGDTSSVAITSQVLVADVPGWETVAWEATEGVEVDQVVVENTEGTVVVDGGRSGQLGPATALTFCGDQITAGAAATEAPWNPLSLVGAAIGVALATVVLLLSHHARRTARGSTPAGREQVA